jgi:hypothetical protein
MMRTPQRRQECPAWPDTPSIVALRAMAIPAARDVRGNGRKANSEMFDVRTS